jgi:hypothetical protein
MKLWDYLNKEHGLILLESEINDILELARQEIELPDEDELKEACPQELLPRISCWIQGAKWALAKVRNPYPKKV